MKKFLTAAILATTILSMVSGCAPKTPSATTSKDDPSSTSAPSTSEKINLTYLNWNGGEEMRLQKEAIAEWESKNPNVKITGQWVTENYDSKINTLVAANETPDIYYINEYLAVDWGEKGVAMDLAPLWEEMGVNMVDTYVPSAVFPYQDKVYGISTGPVCGLLYYNKPMFDEYNIEYPSSDPLNPWTWEQYMDAAKKLTFDTSGKQPGQDGFKPKQMKSFGTTVPTQWLFLQAMLYTGNASFATEDGMATALDTPEAKLVLSSTWDAINTYYVAPDAAVAKTLPGTTQAFKNKQLGMSISGTWEYQNFMKEDIDFGIAPIPSFSKASNISWAATFQISAKTKYPKEAAAFLNFLTDPDVNGRQLEINFPNKKAWYEDQTKFDSWVSGGNFKDDFKVVIPKIMSEIAIVPECVTLKNFNKVVGEVSQTELDKYFAASQDLDTAIANIVKGTDGQWQGTW